MKEEIHSWTIFCISYLILIVKNYTPKVFCLTFGVHFKQEIAFFIASLVKGFNILDSDHLLIEDSSLWNFVE